MTKMTKAIVVKQESVSIAPVVEAQFEPDTRPHREAIQEYLSLSDWVLTDDEDLRLAAEAMNDIRHRADALKTLRESATKPLLAALATIRGWFKSDEDLAADARKMVNEKIAAYVSSKKQLSAAAAGLLTAAVEAQDPEAAQEAIDAMQAAPKVEGLTTYEEWDFEEFNHSIVPTELTAYVPKLVRAEIKRQVAEKCFHPSIAGFRITKRVVVKGTG